MSEPVSSIRTPIRLEYTYSPGQATSRFLRGIAQGRILGQRCPECRKVYVPPHGACPQCGVPTEEEIEVSDKGTVTTFCITRIPSEALSLEVPYVSAYILLDGADIPLLHLVGEWPVDDVRMGMRVQAVWVPPEELKPDLLCIRYFRPTEEPDAPFESYKEHL